MGNNYQDVITRMTRDRPQDRVNVQSMDDASPQYRIGLWWEGFRQNLRVSRRATFAMAAGLMRYQYEPKFGPRGIYRQNTADIPSIQLGIRPVSGGLTTVPGSFVGNPNNG